MDASKATEELTVIRQLMERPIRFSSMSGLAAIQAGLWALAGIAGDYWAFGRLSDPREAMLAGGAIWAVVFVCAVAGVLLLTRRREIAQGMPFWSPVKRRILATILPPFVAAVGLTLIICMRYGMTYGAKGYPFLLQWDLIQGYLIPSIWMLFYGVTLWQLGQFSPAEVKVLGVAFIGAGLATALLWQGYPYWVMGITFGGFHIVYGIVVWIRHGG